MYSNMKNFFSSFFNHLTQNKKKKWRCKKRKSGKMKRMKRDTCVGIRKNRETFLCYFKLE